MKHELLPVPISLARIYGTLRTGNKSELDNMRHRLSLDNSTSCHVIVLYHRLVALGEPDAAVTFGVLADTYVKPVLKAGSEYHRIDVVFDRYRNETSKGTTRTRRSKAARPIRRLVEGRDVPLPKNWSNCLELVPGPQQLCRPGPGPARKLNYEARPGPQKLCPGPARPAKQFRISGPGPARAAGPGPSHWPDHIGLRNSNIIIVYTF